MPGTSQLGHKPNLMFFRSIKFVQLMNSQAIDLSNISNVISSKIKGIHYLTIRLTMSLAQEVHSHQRLNPVVLLRIR